MKIRLYRISFAWNRYGRTFRVSTVWGAASVKLAKEDFAKRNPHVISFRVESEVTP